MSSLYSSNPSYDGEGQAKIPIKMLLELQRKAALWDASQGTSIIKLVPAHIVSTDLIHSVRGGSGIQQFIFHPPTAVVIFTCDEDARKYLDYTRRHGFFVSRRITTLEKLTFNGTGPGETLQDLKSGGTILTTHLPEVTVTFWDQDLAEEKKLQRLFRFNSDVETNGGAGRVLCVEAYIGEVIGILRHAVFDTNFPYEVGCKVEYAGPIGGSTKKTAIKFWSTKEAKLVGHYLEHGTEFQGRVHPGGDPSSRPVEDLMWNTLNKIQRASHHIQEQEGEDKWGFKNKDGWTSYMWTKN